jgi:hypothetical protein
MLAMLHLALVDSAAVAQQKHPITQEDLEWMMRIEPLIIQGMITKVEVILITPKELYGVRNSTGHMPVTEVTMKIEKVIAGEYDGDEIVIVLPEGETEEVSGGPAGLSRMKVNVGERAIVAFKLDSQGTGLNVLDAPSDSRFFRMEGTKLIPYREDLYLAVDNPLEVMAKKADERRIKEKMKEMSKASDLICTGTVTKPAKMDSLSGKWIVSIDETLKGTAEKSEITVDMPDLILTSKLDAPGFRVMLFLKKDDSGYRAVSGFNGCCIMDGERLTSGQGAPVSMSASELKYYIDFWINFER